MTSALLVTDIDGTLRATGHVVGSADELLGRSADGGYTAGALYLRVMIEGTKHFFHSTKDYQQYTLLRHQGGSADDQDAEGEEDIVTDYRYGWPELVAAK
jgi:hypothetical protein